MTLDKKLLQVTKATIYQRETKVDKIRFLFPENYDGISLKDCTVVLKYIDPSNVAHSEILTIEEEKYKDKLVAFLTVDTKLTRFAGDIEVRLTFNQVVDGNQQEVLHTGTTIIPILPLSDYFEFIPEESLEAIDKKIGMLDNKIKELQTISEIYESEMVDDLTVDKSTNTLYVTANGVKVGQGVNTVVISNEKEIDGKDDGIIEINNIDDLVSISNSDNSLSFLEI